MEVNYRRDLYWSYSEQLSQQSNSNGQGISAAAGGGGDGRRNKVKKGGESKRKVISLRWRLFVVKGNCEFKEEISEMKRLLSESV